MAHPLERERWPTYRQKRWPTYTHRMTPLLTHSYSKLKVFEHKYKINEQRYCPAIPPYEEEEEDEFGERTAMSEYFIRGEIRKGVSALDFDCKGKYLASVTRAGCLTIHDYEVLYSEAQRSTSLANEENNCLLHFRVSEKLDVVKWNPLNQNQVSCTSARLDKLILYDIHVGWILEGRNEYRTRTAGGLTDVCFASNSQMIFASALDYTLNGSCVNVWDPRQGKLPCYEIGCYNDHLYSIELDIENKIIFCGGMYGCVYAWDVRGGRGAHPIGHAMHPTLATVRLNYLIKKLGLQGFGATICSVRRNPSCPHQLAFYLENGMLGILDMYNFNLTHFHALPETVDDWGVYYGANPSWLATCSIYLASHRHGIRLLDFTPSHYSPCHLDHRRVQQDYNYIDVPSYEPILSCAAHPWYNAIVAGTKESSLIVISQKRKSIQGGEVERLQEDEDEHEDEVVWI